MSSNDLDIQVLGPLTVVREGADLPVGGPRQRAVLARLLLDPGRAVPAERLLEDVWGEGAGGRGTGPVRTYIWKLRGALGEGVVLSHPAGYLLDVDREQLDSVRFERLFAEARTADASGQPERARHRLEEGLGLWHGPALGDLATEPALRSEATRLDQLRLGARELRAEVLLTLGQHAQVATELEALARANPTRERFWAMLMTALYRCGRQRDALRCFQDARQALGEEMGLDPGPELRDLEQAVLRQDADLDWQPRSGPGPVPVGSGAAAGSGAALAGAPANLPRHLTTFVGRGAERAEVLATLGRSRLVTLAGAGGCGKTRLAVAVAEEAQPLAPEGTWFVDLSAVSDPALIARAVAEPLGVGGDLTDVLDHLCQRIAGGQVLLVLDNCEHLVEPVAKLVEELLARCPSLRILATSREELGIGAEAVWRVPALSLPGEGRGPGGDPGDPGGPDPVLESEAVQLFVERARSALAGFDPTGGALDAVAQICRRLDGIPLAVELAAALVGSLPVAGIAARLDDHLGLLTEGRRQAVPRHRTLRSTLDWSFDLLDGPAQDLFVRLGVFVGDFTLAAAEDVAGDSADPLAVARGLGHLVRTSMVTCVAGSDGAERYRMLETVRQYARERLASLPDAEALHRRHARHYADFAAEAERHVHGPAAPEWLARVVSELPNLRAAMAWAISHDDIEAGLRLAGPLHWYFARMGLLDEASRWLQVWLPRRGVLAPELRLMALVAAGTVAFTRGDFNQTRALGEEAVAIARRFDDPQQLAMALIVRGGAAVYEGDPARAEECFAEASVLFDRLGDRWGTAWMLTMWGAGSRRAGDLPRARGQLEGALEAFRRLGDRHGQVLPLVNLALVVAQEGDPPRARAVAAEAHDLANEVGERQLQHVSLCVLGRVELALDHPGRAREMLLRSIRDYPGAHNRVMLAVALEGLARLTGLAGHHGDAMALLGFTQTMRERWQTSLPGPRARERDDWQEGAREAVGPELVEVELARGRDMGFEEAVRLAETRTAELRG